MSTALPILFSKAKTPLWRAGGPLGEVRPVLRAIENALALQIGNAYDVCVQAITDAIQLIGGQTALATILGVKQPTVSEWTRGERAIPSDRCPSIERATAGRVTCERLRPDVRWVRVPDVTWPHNEGRPCIDVAIPVSEARDAA